MYVDLKPAGFPFFKVVFSAIFLAGALIFPIQTLIAAVVIFFSKVHTLGAWIAMWRAKRLSWTYMIFCSVLIVGLSYLGVKVLSVYTLSFIAFSIFAFHFCYDEYELQEEKRTFENIVLMLSPMILFYLIIIRDYFLSEMDFVVFLGVFVLTTILEFIYIRKINWMYLSSKTISIFLLVATYFGYRTYEIYFTVLMIHYIFWVAYPVYKLNKYVKEDRDDFIMILTLIILMSAFIYSTKIWTGIDESKDFLTRTFFVATLVHTFSTAPFGYWFGLRRRAYELKK